MTRLPFDFNARDMARSFPSLVDALNRAGFLERTIPVRLQGQTLQGVSIDNHTRTQTTTFESWYPAGQVTDTALTTTSVAVNTLIAVPFVASPHAWDRIAFELTTVSGANGKARVGVYAVDEAREGSMYPGALLVQGGDTAVSSGTGAKSTTINYQPQDGRLYFAAYLCGTAAPTVRAIPVAGIRAHLGFPSTLGATGAVGYTVASTYSTTTLPATFPTGATARTSPVPAVFLRHVASGEFTRTYPVESIERDGFVLRRAALLSSVDVETTTTGPYFTVSAAVRSGGRTTVMGTYDSRSHRLRAGESFSLYDRTDDTDLAEGDVTEVLVMQSGKPVVDLAELTATLTTAYVGGS